MHHERHQERHAMHHQSHAREGSARVPGRAMITADEMEDKVVRCCLTSCAVPPTCRMCSLDNRRCSVL